MAMELRKHPLVSYRNQSSWPPAWIWIGGNENNHPRGEVGVLKQLKLVDGPFVNRCFLWMQYEDSMYLGLLPQTQSSTAHLCCQQRGKMLETRTKLRWVTPAALSASSKEASLSL